MARRGFLAAAFALVVQVIAWAWMPVWTAPVTDGETIRITVCTPQGFKLVVLDASNDAPSTPPGKPLGEKADGQCPLCPLVAGLAFAPATPLVLPVEARRHTSLSLPGSRIATGWFLATLQARGPPQRA